MPFTEDELLPISALQHLLFCERQCALIHVERLWEENRFTVEGNLLHEKAHEGKPETRDGVRITRGLSLHSFTLGLVGQADVIEWDPGIDPPSGQSLAQFLRASTADDRADWTVTPVEHKRGKPKSNDCDRVQLCAQAMCLEEMLGLSIPVGKLFYGEKRRRVDVECDEQLRGVTVQAANRLREIVSNQITPSAVKDKRCDKCSLIHHCLPAVTGESRSVETWINRMISDGGEGCR